MTTPEVPAGHSTTSLGDLLRRHRVSRGLSQEELAARVEPPLSPDTISNLERGRTRPHRATLMSLCQTLELEGAVREELWSAWQMLTARAHVAPSAPADDRFPRRSVFVGRATESERLQAAFDSARAGRGALTMLAGEPGIGKTTLCEQLALSVASSGGRALVGHCYEERSFRPPYQPFVEALGSYLLACEPTALRTAVGTGAADLPRMIPTLAERLNSGPPPPRDPEGDRWRLLQAATDVLRRAALQHPLLLVLEDLHDADSSTLDLLLYLARNLQNARLLVLGTYRDVNVDRDHPLSLVLSELQRSSTFTRLHLRGLSPGEVQKLLAETSKQAIAQPFAELVHRHTDGNPLFAHEILRYVIDEGLVERRDGALRRVGEESLAGRIPDGLRDAVRKRLTRLRDDTNRALSVAAVIGREFQLDILRHVLGRPEEELEDALEQATAAAIVEERSVVGTSITYRFTHAFFRQTLYDEIVAPRRVRLHQQVARALEDVYQRRLEEHVDELAEHYSFSSDARDLTRAVHYAELAAKRAAEVFAYAEAARHLQRALLAQERMEPDDPAKRCDLLLALGDVLMPAGETERVVEQVAPDALALADGLADGQRAFRACRLAFDSIEIQNMTVGTSQPIYLTWVERAATYAAPESLERIHVDLALANAFVVRGRWQETRALRLQALALARQLNDPDSLFRSTFFLIIAGAPQHWQARALLAEEAARWPRQGVSGRLCGHVLWMCGALQLAQGRRERALQIWGEVEELADRTHVVEISLYVPFRDAFLALVDGHLEDALRLAQQVAEHAAASGSTARARGTSLGLLLATTLYLGCPEVWLTEFEDFLRASGPNFRSPVVTGYRAMCLADLGRPDEARNFIGPRLDAIADSGIDDETQVLALVAFLQAAIALEHRAAGRALSARLACLAHLSMAIGDWAYTCIARHLGEAATLDGDPVAARAYYIQALSAASKIGHRPELALTHLRLAELLLDVPVDTDRAEALEHLDVAIPELRDMHMQPSLERALALRQTLLVGADHGV